MALPSVYTQVYGQIPEFFAKIQEGQAPSTFTQQHLKDIGFASTNHRAFIPILKTLGFLTASGVPTSVYHSYRDKSQSKSVLGKAIKEAYSDIFLINSDPSDKDKDLIEGKFKSAHNAKDRPAELMAKTFFGLLDIADIKHEPKAKKEKPESHEEEPIKNDPPKTDESVQIKYPSLNYNIQIHLPATKDIEVYNSIFKSLKEHLLG